VPGESTIEEADMLALVKKPIIALLVVATLSSGARDAWANSDIDFGTEAAHDAGVVVIAFTAVGVAALVGLVTWLVVSNWPEDELEVSAAEAPDGPAVAVAESPTEVAPPADPVVESAPRLADDERRARRASRKVSIAGR
jgi:hypothetical protein